MGLPFRGLSKHTSRGWHRWREVSGGRSTTGGIFSSSHSWKTSSLKCEATGSPLQIFYFPQEVFKNTLDQRNSVSGHLHIHIHYSAYIYCLSQLHLFILNFCILSKGQEALQPPCQQTVHLLLFWIIHTSLQVLHSTPVKQRFFFFHFLCHILRSGLHSLIWLLGESFPK